MKVTVVKNGVVVSALVVVELEMVGLRGWLWTGGGEWAVLMVAMVGDGGDDAVSWV